MLKRVLIKWVDSRGVTSDWEWKDELKPFKPYKLKTLGFLLHDKKKFKTVVLTIGKDQVLGKITIPTSAIISMKIL